MRLPTRISALGLTLLTAGCGPERAPGDASIIARFAAHRTKFSQLLEMFRRDGIDGRFGCDGPPDDAIIPGEPPTRLVETTDNYRWTQKDRVQDAVTMYRHIDGPWLEYDAN